MCTFQGSQSKPLATNLDDLVARACNLAEDGSRRILGITGAPGAGKSTLCTALIRALGGRAVLIGMDGFHLANEELVRLGRRDRKGAPDTFDIDGYVALLQRLQNQTEGVIYAPFFNRAIEESIGSAVPVKASVPLIITEGNYLLYQHNGWQVVRTQLDQSWYLQLPADERVKRLVLRRQSHGDTVDRARAWVYGVDEANAGLVETSRGQADLLIQLTSTPGSGNPISAGIRE